ncbi:MAG: aminotransferase class V-fold PLP-dependent enzyme, partial [Bacteroidota bacterium]
MDIAKLRAETPGCQSKLHFNNAGAALMPEPVIRAMKDHLELELMQGGYEAADQMAQEIKGFHQAVAKLIGTKAENIAFTSSATNSYARALSCIPFKNGDAVLIANEDYVSNQLAFLSLQERFGIRLLRAPSAPEGGVDVEALEKLAREHRPVLVSITHVPTNTGLVQPVEAVGRVCRALDIPFLVDACQSVGQLPVDVEAFHCDFLSATFRKFLRGPRGAGFLYVSDRILQKGWYPLFIDLRGANWTDPDQFQVRESAIRFEDWELPYALVLGSKVATEYALAVGIKEIAERTGKLTTLIRSR